MSKQSVTPARRPSARPSGKGNVAVGASAGASSAASRWMRGATAGSAAACLLAGAAFAWLPLTDESSGRYISGTLVKVGVVLGLVWLCAPQLERLGWRRLRGTLLVALVVTLVLFSIRPRLGAIAAAVLVGGSLFLSLLGWFRALFGSSDRPSR